MKRELQFLAGYIDKGIIESKVWPIKDAFQSDDCFNGVPDEPGIYIPTRFGVRIEDTVLITKYASQNLTMSDKNYVVVGI